MKSSKQKEVEGTARRDRKKRYAEFSGKRPEAPDFIREDAAALKIYDSVCEFLANYKLLEQVDKYMIAQFAATWLDYMKYREQVEEVGLDHMLGKNGARQPTTQYKAMQDAMTNIRHFEKSLGLSPKARSLMKEMFVEVEEKDKAKDPFMNVIKGNKKAANG